MPHSATTKPADQARRPGLWADPNFVKLWVAQTVSKFGTHITNAALAAAAVLTLQATPAQLGLLGAVAGLPVLLISLLAGVWVDRRRRRPVLIAADIGRAFILLSIPMAALIGALSMTQLYIVAGLVGMLTVLYNVADQSFLPAVVAPDRLVEANARIGASESLAEIAGPSIAGTLMQWLGAPYAILVDASSYLFSAASLGLIRTTEPPPEPAPQHPNVWREMLEGLRIIAHHPILRALLGATATLRFFGSFIGTVYWLYLVRDLALPPAIVGLSIGVGGIGALLGALVAERLTHRLGTGRTLIGSLIAAPLLSAVLLLPLVNWSVGVVSALLFVMQLVGDIFWAVFFIDAVSLRQATIPAYALGRTSASLDFIGEGAAPVGALIAGAVATAIGARWTWLLGAAGILTGSLWLFFSPLRRARIGA